MINSKEELPKKWCIKLSEDNYFIINNWLKTQSTQEFWAESKVGYVCNYPRHDGSFRDYCYEGKNCKKEGATDITFEKFKKYVLNMETRKILTYKLIKEEYASACIKITDFDGTPQTFMEYRLSVDGNFVKRLRRAGVLDLWFEPVYKSSEITIKMGNIQGGTSVQTFDLIVKDSKVFHNNEDITSFVTELVDNLKHLFNTKEYGTIFKKYPCVISNVIFSKTGCQNIESSLGQWIQVYDELKKQQ